MHRAARLLQGLGPLVVATLALAVVSTRAVLQRTGGEPAVPLDDAFIHFQYARSFARLEPFVYTPGAEPAAGATSLLWPLLLAPFSALGLDSGVIWAAWALCWTALGLLSFDTYRSALGLVSRESALAAGAMVLAFGGYAWCAGSGMEVVPFAWLLMRSARRVAEWAEDGRGTRTELCALGWLSPLMRPEGVIASLLVTAVLLRRPRGGRRAWALVPLLGPLVPPLVNLAFTGQLASTTTIVKWLPASPYYGAAELAQAIAGNLAVLFGTLLDGEIWSATVLPKGGAIVAWLAVPALVVAGVRERRRWRAAALIIIALGMLIPTTYDSFLWNRLRYLWPFAAAWFVGAAALADVLGALAARARPELASLRVLVAGFFAGALAGHLGFAIDDLATSADAVRRQQVSLGRWAKDALSPNAVLGVNDTGAIAYFSGRRVFDVVGLTTPGEARHWAAGAGARFEHYERLGAARLPTHFIVYPEWMAMPELLGRRLTERTVSGASILGGTTMVAYEANLSALGSGERLDEPRLGPVVDSLDVADLDSEAAHAYELFDAEQRDCIVVSELDGRAEGGRARRTRERFDLTLQAGGLLLARLGASEPTILTVRVSEHKLGKLSLEADSWQEISLELPPNAPAGRQRVEIEAQRDRRFVALHYWSIGRGRLEQSRSSSETR